METTTWADHRETLSKRMAGTGGETERRGDTGGSMSLQLGPRAHSLSKLCTFPVRSGNAPRNFFLAFLVSVGCWCLLLTPCKTCGYCVLDVLRLVYYIRVLIHLYVCSPSDATNLSFHGYSGIIGVLGRIVQRFVLSAHEYHWHFYIVWD